MVKYEQLKVTEPGMKGNLELLKRDSVLSIPNDDHPDQEKTEDHSDNHQEDVDAKLAGPFWAEKYKPWIPSEDQEYTSDDQLINESEPKLGSATSEIEQIERLRSSTSLRCCCVREDFKFTSFRAKGLLFTIHFYANLVLGWMLAITWARIADRSNWLLPSIIMGSLIASNIFCSGLVYLVDRWRGFFGRFWPAPIVTDILGFSMLKVLALEWRTHARMKFCQYLSAISALNSYVIFVITSYCLAVASSEDLIAFEPTPLVRFCWLISCCSLGVLGMFEDDDEDHQNWNRNFWYSVGTMLTTFFLLIGLCTPFIYVCWWPNAGLYGIVFGILLFICAIFYYLDVPNHRHPATIFRITFGLVDLGFASVQLYILIHEQCTCDIGLAFAGGIVAGWYLVLAYIFIGHFAMKMSISIFRCCNFYIRDLLQRRREA